MRSILALLMLIPAPAFARPRACRVVVQKNVIVANQVAVPFAVPVGVPVATAQPVGAFYSAHQYTPQTASSAATHPHGTAAAAGDAALFQEFLAWRQQRAAAQSKPSFVTQACAKCHGGDGMKAAIDHFNLSELETPEGRLKAMRAVLSQRMPKGKTLDPESVGNVLTELAGEDQAPEPPKAQLAPPPEAVPPEPMPPKPEKDQ